MKRLIAVFLTALMVMALCVVFSSAEDVNLVKGLDGGVAGYSTTNKYTANLTDGQAKEELTYDDNWFGFYWNVDTTGAENKDVNAPGKVGTLVYDLGENCTINKARIHVALCNTSGIQSPKKITVSVSEDGKTYAEFASKSYEIPADKATDTSWEEFTGAARVGRFVKVTVELQSVFVFLNEVEVLGVKGGDPSNNPAPVSSDDTESSKAEESKPADESKTESKTESKVEESKTESKTETSKTETSKTESVSSGEVEGSDMTWLWIVIAVVAVAAIVVLVVVSTKKKK